MEAYKSYFIDVLNLRLQSKGIYIKNVQNLAKGYWQEVENQIKSKFDVGRLAIECANKYLASLDS